MLALTSYSMVFPGLCIHTNTSRDTSSFLRPFLWLGWLHSQPNCETGVLNLYFCMWILCLRKISFVSFFHICRLTFGGIKTSTADHLSRFLRHSQTYILQLLGRRCAWRLGMVLGAQLEGNGRLQPLATVMLYGKSDGPLPLAVSRVLGRSHSIPSC